MKKRKLQVLTTVIVGFAIAGIVYAADHIDSPTVTSQPTDITDLYVFQGQSTSNLVFVANSQGLLSPSAASTAKFDANTLLEFNIDNNADNIEDLVIQCKYDATSNKMMVYGPINPSQTGTRSKLEGAATAEVGVTPYASSNSPLIGTGTSGIKVFAGPRDDPFFFDLGQYKKILAGQATGFNNPGTDAFAGTNVLSVVVEVPKTLLNATSGKVNVWLETKKKI